MTAVANAVFTAAEYNSYVRDNLLETMPAKATTAGRWFVATGLNSIAERQIATNTVDTSETTSSTSYTNLTTTGPAVTVTTGTKAMVFITAQMTGHASEATVETYASYEVSGATSSSATDARAIVNDVGANDNRISVGSLHTGLTAGSNTFTMKYKCGTGAANPHTFLRRTITVMAL